MMYSIATNFFSEDKEAVIGYLESFMGLGCFLGPLLGSLLYTIGGYQFIFYSFGGFFLIGS